MDFLKKVHETVEKGGKVLIPVFALGRAQELCILLETFWDRMNLKVYILICILVLESDGFSKNLLPIKNSNIKISLPIIPLES